METVDDRRRKALDAHWEAVQDLLFDDNYNPDFAVETAKRVQQTWNIFVGFCGSSRKAGQFIAAREPVVAPAKKFV